MPRDADADGDGLVNMDEAFLYAEAMDFSKETPQYGENPLGLGERLILSGGSILYVPDDHATIQAAIAAASDHDHIRVRAGTYAETLDFWARPSM